MRAHPPLERADRGVVGVDGRPERSARSSDAVENEEEAAEMLAGYLAREGWSVTPSPFSPRGTGLQNRRFQVRVLGSLHLAMLSPHRLTQSSSVRHRRSRGDRPVRGVLAIANRSHTPPLVRRASAGALALSLSKSCRPDPYGRRRRRGLRSACRCRGCRRASRGGHARPGPSGHRGPRLPSRRVSRFRRFLSGVYWMCRRIIQARPRSARRPGRPAPSRRAGGTGCCGRRTCCRG